MKIRWDTKILDLKGDPIKDADGSEVTLSTVTCATLIMVLKGDENLGTEDKVKLFKLAQRAANGAEGEITVDEAALLKKRVGLAYGALIIGRVCEIIEGEGAA